MASEERELDATRSESAERPAGQRRALWYIAGGQLLALTLWFSASAVGPQLQDAWSISSGQAAWLTLTVQIGFVVGALASSVFALPDAIASRKLFTLAALAGAVLNLLLIPLGPRSFTAAFLLRFLTGVALAGVYPSGLKAMAGWFRHGRGMALGTLVGALTIGSAGPHLIRGLGFEWQGVLFGASALAAIGALILWFGVTDGPYETAPVTFSWHYVGAAVRNRGVQLSTFGYLGHMWELYAMWTWTAAFLAASALAGGYGDGWVPVATFAIIASGGIGSMAAGVLADRIGRTKVAGGAMAISGTCALLTPLVFSASPVLVIGLFLVWGVTVVADSAQFSTMVTETADDEYRGTALALQTAIGFLLTLVTIKGVPLLADSWGWRWAFPLLAVGPLLGVVAMVRLKRSPEAAKLAGGLG
jgi:MFS family permease